MISIQNLSIYHGKKRVLHLDHLEIPDKYTGLLTGENGSGKSSLIRSILCIHNQFEGKILIDGKDNRELSRKEIASKISYLPQSAPVEQDISVKDFIKQGLYAGPGDWEQSAEALSIEPLLDKSYIELSGGQKQLCRIARAFAPKVDYTFLDEPDSYLSKRNKERFLNLVDLYQEERSIIIVSHYSAFPYSVLKELDEDMAE